MKSIHAYFGTFIVSGILCFLVAMFLTPKTPVAKFPFPSRHIFISSYGDRDVIHRIVYHGLFSFGQHMKEADILIVGNSHAELGLSAEQMSNILSAQLGRKIKAMNIGVGWGEGFQFQKSALEHHHLNCKVVLLELCATLNQSKMTAVGEPVIRESKFSAYTKVFDAWTITTKDWLFDGILPHISYTNSKFVIGRYLSYPVGFRQWKNGDVWDYWFPNYGEVYKKTPLPMITYPKEINLDVGLGNIVSVKKNLDPVFLHDRKLQLITTLIPSNNLYVDLYSHPIKQLGLPYLSIPFAGIELYDHSHANALGRQKATTALLDLWQKNGAAFEALQMLNSCQRTRSG